jgi:uncharacterized protein
MICDSLTHVTTDGSWFHTNYDASEARLVRELEISQIGRAVVVALAGFIRNDFVLEVCQRHPELLIAGASFNPAAYITGEQAARELRAELYQQPYHVLKLHPRLNRYDPLDERCLAVLAELASWARPLPVWLDSLFHFRGGVLQQPVVETIHMLVNRFSALTFVILHSGGSWVLQVAEAISDCPNVFLDLSFVVQRYVGSSVWNDLQYLLRRFDQRLVFGSDFPEISPAAALADFERLAEGLPVDKRENILSKNLMKILMVK